ncbi:MAG: type VI secretion system protein TssA [Enterobacteriaceae bacterium]|jgi:type VI secretion system protein ImpA|nr:type VI secretion system protein TssA [Enterobacteriaceae bacterium]
MNIDVLLAPISENDACGENLEYDDEFLLLERLLVGKTEQQFGEVIIPAEPPDWRKVEEKATELFCDRTKDIRIIIALMHAWVEKHGLCGYADGLNLLRQTLERYWEEVWPRLESEEEYDPLFRLNALAGIEDGFPLALKVQHAVLLKSISQELSFQQVYSLLDGTITEVTGYTGGRTRLLDELKQQADTPEMSAIVMIRDHLLALIDMIRQRLSAGYMPELSKTLKHLNIVIEFAALNTVKIDNISSDTSEQNAESEPTEIDQSPTHTATPTHLSEFYWHEVEIHNRDEARMLLEKVKTYFLTYEPSHPAPMMIERIQQLVDLDFIHIVNNLAPEGLNQLAIIFGLTSGSNDDRY